MIAKNIIDIIPCITVDSLLNTHMQKHLLVGAIVTNNPLKMVSCAPVY